MRLKNSSPQTTQTPKVSIPTVVVPATTTSSTTMRQTPPMQQAKATTGSRATFQRRFLARVALWGIGLVPLVALVLTIKPRIETRLHQERVASRKEPLAVLPVPPGNYIVGMATGPENRFVLAFSGLYLETQNCSGVQRFDLGTAKPLEKASSLKGELAGSGIAFTPDGKSLVQPMVISTGPRSERHTIEFREGATGQLQKRAELVDSPSKWHTSGMLSPDSSYYVRPVNHGTLQLLDTSSGKLVKTLEPLEKLPETARASTSSVAISENSDWIAARVEIDSVYDTGKNGAEIMVWHRKSEKPLWRTSVCGSGGGLRPVAVGKNGEVLAVLDFPESAHPGTLSVARLDARRGNVLWSFPTLGGDVVRSLALSPDGRLVAMDAYDYIEVRRMTDGAPVAQWKRPSSMKKGASVTQSLKFTPDGSRLLDVLKDRVAVWSLAGLK